MISQDRLSGISKPLPLGYIWTLTNNSLHILGAKPLNEAEFSIVSEPYALPTRGYHGVPHLGELTYMTEPEYFAFIRGREKEYSPRIKAMGQVAGIYHDPVQIHIDGGLTKEIEAIVCKYIEPTDDSKKQWRMKDCQKGHPAHVGIVMDIFAVKPGQELNPRAGQNEFISALLKAEMLEKKDLSLAAIAQGAALIEATIPFRPNEKFCELEGRLSVVNKKYNLGLPEDEVKETFRAAVAFANKDVFNMAGFLEPEPVKNFQNYIQNSWKLIPELNPPLMGTEFTPTQYRVALQGMQKFNEMLLDGKFLSVDNIFHHTSDYPSTEDLEKLNSAARQNIETANLYLKTKVVSAAIVEALAIKSGALGVEGGAQTSLFDFVNGIGDKLEKNSSQASPVLPAKRIRPSEKITEEALKREVVLSTLNNRGDSSVAFGFDIPQSPIGKFVFERLSTADIDKVFSMATNLASADAGYVAKKTAAEDFLRDCVGVIGGRNLEVIVRSVADLSESKPTRAGVLARFAEELSRSITGGYLSR